MIPIVYQDFDLRIELIIGTQNHYRVHVINSPSGQANGEFTLPFSEQELENMRHSGLPELETAQAFGRALFTSVFADQIQICLQRSLDTARGKGQRIRLILRLTDAPALIDLPWEFLFSPLQSHFLACSINSPVVRFFDLPQVVEPLRVPPPLKILIMMANPRDYAVLDVKDEWQKIKNALSKVEERGLVELTLLEAATLDVLQHQLRRDQYHIFHFVGHGNFDQKSEQGTLLLEDSEGHSYMEDGQRLGSLLRDHPSLRLVLLNSCEGARSSYFHPFGGVARHLVQQGIPAVIAMQFEITDTAAIALASEFYAAMADSYPVEAALTEARKAMYNRKNDAEWATPVLYMRTNNGQLFSLETEKNIDDPLLVKSAIAIVVSTKDAVLSTADADIVESFPQQWELQNILAQLYEEEDGIRRVVAAASLNEQLISLSGRSIDIWRSIIKEVAKLYRLNDLFQVALADYGTNPRLQELYSAYLEAAKLGKNPEVAIELQSERAEYTEWRIIQNQKFQHLLHSEIASRSAFRQVLNVADEQVRLVERQKLWGTLDKWLSIWREQKTFILLGEEGDGKTWGIAAWLHKKLSEETTFPPVVFLPAAEVASNTPWELISNALHSHNEHVPRDEWNDRIEQWLDYPSQTAPTLLIVLDGINQWHDPSWWRPLLEKTMADKHAKDEYSKGKYFTNVAFIVTCRTEYWVRNYSGCLTMPTPSFVLQRYDDSELDQALNFNHLKRTEFSDKLLELVRKPRHFDSAVRHRNEIGSLEDVTVTRLVYEDWRYIYNQKSDTPVSDIEFRELLRQLAEKQVERTNSFKRRELDQILKMYPNHFTLLEELRTSRKLHIKEGNVGLSEHIITMGLGLLLVDQLLAAHASPNANLMEDAATWLENNAGKDISANISEMAVLHALPDPDITQEIKVTLLLVWLNNQNLGQDVDTKFTAYLLDNTDSYLDLCERVWTNDPGNRKVQGLLLSAFLHWYPKSLQVSKALEMAIERWLGMVHIAGFPYQRGNELEKTEEIIERISQRVGFQLQPGNNFIFAGRTMMAIDDDGLLRLGRAALAIISHFDRAPFAHSIATGCVAEAIMDHPDKYDLFRWVLSTAAQSVWGEVRNEIEQLLPSNSPVIQQAASRLLLFEGSKQADVYQKSLPADLFPEHFLYAEYRRDPCRSFFAWSKSTCESCLQRTDLEAQYLARRIESHALNPSLSVPDELHPRFAALAETIDTEQIWSTMGTGVQDLAYEQYEVALCAISPQSLAHTIRRVVHKIPTRGTFALRQVSFHLREHALLFEEEELKSIYQAWRQLALVALPWEEAQETAEMMLFAFVLSNLGAEEQLTHLLQRPENASIDLLLYEDHFLPIKAWSTVIDQFSECKSEQNLLRLLWFISVHAKQIPADFLFTHIMPHIESSSAQVRRLAMKVIHTSDNRYLNFAIVGGWKREQDNLEEENLIGSLVLCHSGHLLPIESLYQRIEASYWGYAVQCRGSKISELEFFAEKIHALWQQISTRTTDLPEYLPKANIRVNPKTNDGKDTRPSLSISSENQERWRWRAPDQTWGGDGHSNHLGLIFPTEEEINAQQAQAVTAVQAVTEQEIALGNPWFAHHFEMDALEDVVIRRPDLLVEWLQAVNEQNEQWLRILQRCHSFYEALCRVLLKCSPEEGVSLYLQMAQVNILSIDTQTRWQIVDRTLFQTMPVEAITGLWTKKLEECTTDAQLLTLASMLQWGTGQRWLWTYIEQQLTSSAPICISRGATLLGYYDAGQAQMRLDQLYQDAPDTWVKQLLETSIQRWKLNHWSRHWFSKIFASDTNVEAWAAFRLFLHCVDSRFWIWCEQAREVGAVYPHFERRWHHIEINWETIRNRIRKNEAGFAKQLFGQKVLHNQVWPWM